MKWPETNPDPNQTPRANSQRRLFRRPCRWAVTYAGLLLLAVGLVLLDAFVIPRAGLPVGKQAAVTAGALAGSVNALAKAPALTPVITADSYADDQIQIRIETIHQYDTDLYIADIQLTSIAYLRTAFARNTFGRNFREATSAMASANAAILAINGDYYGVRDYGFVLRNGLLCRSIARPSGLDEALLMDTQGNFHIVHERHTSAETLAAGAWQIFTFGPALVEDSQVAENVRSTAAQTMPVNPRAAIGQVAPLHYVFIVSDGRSRSSTGLSLLQLGQIFIDRQCTVAYNLDGGGSATLWFHGQVINNPTDGRASGERSVSDIVYIGYR